MNANESRELREERAKLARQMVDLAGIGLKTPEDRQKYDVMDVAQKELKERIDRIERASSLTEELRSTGKPPAGQPGDGSRADDPETQKVRERYDRSFRNMLKYGWVPRPQYGILGITDEERSILTPQKRTVQIEGRDVGQVAEFRDMGTGGGGAYPSSTTGFFVPVGFTNRVEEALKYYGPMLNGGVGYPEIFDTATGQQLPFPTDNDTTVTGELVGEGQQTNTGDVSINQILLGAYKYSSKLVKVSIELLQDSAFDIEAYLIKKFGIRIGRILNNHFTVGAGTNQPKGIITASVSGATAVGSAGNDGSGATGANSVGSDDLVAIEHSVDPLYRNGAKFMFHDSTLKALKQLKDKYGRPLWLPGLAAGTPDTINSYPFLINNDMDQIATTKKTVVFGALDKYLIRRVKDISVLRLEERFADYGQVAFLAFARYDGNLLDAGTNPVKFLTQA